MDARPGAGKGLRLFSDFRRLTSHAQDHTHLHTRCEVGVRRTSRRRGSGGQLPRATICDEGIEFCIAMPAGRSKANPRDQYFKAIKENGQGRSMDTLRWTLRHGGVSLRAEDADGHTGFQIAASGGYGGSMEVLLEFLKKLGSFEDLEMSDEDGRTPLMMAAYNGKYDMVKLLVREGKAKLGSKCDKGKTAHDYATERSTPMHAKIATFLDNPKQPDTPEEDEEDEEEARKRVFLASQRVPSQTICNKAQLEKHEAREAAAEETREKLAASEKPVWEEVPPPAASYLRAAARAPF